MDGIGLLKEIKSQEPDINVVWFWDTAIFTPR